MQFLDCGLLRLYLFLQCRNYNLIMTSIIKVVVENTCMVVTYRQRRIIIRKFLEEVILQFFGY